MPEARIEFHPAAVAETEAARGWYEARNASAVYAFLVELDHAVAQVVASSPTTWPRFSSDTRRYVFPRFPFSLVFVGSEHVIKVIAAAHHRRKPSSSPVDMDIALSFWKRLPVYLGWLLERFSTYALCVGWKVIMAGLAYSSMKPRTNAGT